MSINGLRYSIGEIRTRDVRLREADDILEALALDHGDVRIGALTQLIVTLLKQEEHRNAPICIEGLSWDDIALAPTETLISFLLFERGVTECNMAMRSGEVYRINSAFVDFNYAMHYSISPQMLGLCCLHRAFYLPKQKGEKFQENAIMQNELNIAKRVIDIDSSVYKKFVGDYKVIDAPPDVYYYFLSDCVDDGSRYKYTYKISPLSNYVSILSPNPSICFDGPIEVYGLLKTILLSEDCLLLSRFEFGRDAFEISYVGR